MRLVIGTSGKYGVIALVCSDAFAALSDAAYLARDAFDEFGASISLLRDLERSNTADHEAFLAARYRPPVHQGGPSPLRGRDRFLANHAALPRKSLIVRHKARQGNFPRS